MAKLPVYNTKGEKVGEATLEPKIFDVKVNPRLVQQAVRTQLNNSRVAIAHTKTRAEVRGGGKKPWRQKGTGRARHGSTRSPIWKGGGVTFGPRKNRNFTIKLNRQAKKQALFMALSDRAKEGKITLVDTIAMPRAKTKDFLMQIAKLPLQKTILLVLPTTDQNIIKSVRNVPFITVINANSLNVVDILNHQCILAPKASLDVITKTYIK